MRRRYGYSRGGNSDSTGCVIFLIILIFLPAIGWITSHIKWIIIGIVAIFMIIYFIRDDFKSNITEQEIEEEGAEGE